jgi:hypothetical protein
MRRTPQELWLQLPQPFATAEASAAGIARSSVCAAARRGDLLALAKGLYAARPAWESSRREEHSFGLAMAGGRLTPGTAVSHSSAAAVHGLPHPQLGPRKVSLTALESSKTSWPEDWRRVLQAGMPRPHLQVHDGVLVTSPARTVVDSFRQLRLPDALAIADAAVGRGLTSKPELEVVRRFQRRWPHVSKAASALPWVDGRRESWLESASAAVMHRLGMPLPLSQVWLYAEDGSLIGRVDFLWPRSGIAGEADGFGKYRGDFDPDKDSSEEAVARRLVAERQRERRLENGGLGVARWGHRDLYREGWGLEAALRDAATRAQPERVDFGWRLGLDEPVKPWRDLLALLAIE